jgi:spore maturation protein SpmB
MTAAVAGIVLYFTSLPNAEMVRQSSLVSNFLLFSIIIIFLTGAALRKVNVYDTFIEGAKEGFGIAISIIPYLVAMLVAIAVFRASGAMDLLLGGVRWIVNLFGWDNRFVEGLPTAFMKPLSGSGARAMMVETMQTYGADSFAGRLASVIQGSTETTFYVLAVYFGSVGIRYTRHAVACALLADLAGIVVAIWVSYLFFG